MRNEKGSEKKGVRLAVLQFDKMLFSRILILSFGYYPKDVKKLNEKLTSILIMNETWP